MKDSVRLLVYLLATVLLGALLAPPIFWLAQSLAAHGVLSFLSRYDFETFFHRALLVAAVLLAWPLARSIEIRSLSDLQLAPNPHRRRDLLAGILLSALPLLLCSMILLASPMFSLRAVINWTAIGRILLAALFVPLIEEAFFRGLVLGALLKTGRQFLAVCLTSILYSIVHFLKAPEHTSTDVTWTSGFNSIGHAFAQFGDPVLVGAGFTTLFLIGWILAEARLLTRSLWLSIGLHAGWIFTAGVFNKVALRQWILLPWMGKNLLVGIVPLLLACVTWLLLRGWVKYVNARDA